MNRANTYDANAMIWIANIRPSHAPFQWKDMLFPLIIQKLLWIIDSQLSLLLMGVFFPTLIPVGPESWAGSDVRCSGMTWANILSWTRAQPTLLFYFRYYVLETDVSLMLTMLILLTFALPFNIVFIFLPIMIGFWAV